MMEYQWKWDVRCNNMEIGWNLEIAIATFYGNLIICMKIASAKILWKLEIVQKMYGKA